MGRLDDFNNSIGMLTHLKLHKTHFTWLLYVSATGLTVRLSNPGTGETLHVVQTGPETHPVSCPMCIGYFLAVKRLEPGADDLTSSTPGLRIIWNYTPASPMCLHTHVMRRPLPLLRL